MFETLILSNPLNLTMSEALTILREKLAWLLKFLEITGKSIHSTTNNLMEAIQIPRNAVWKDSHILNIVEISNRHRILLDEKHALFKITILTDINNFIAYMDSVLGDIHNEYESTERILERLGTEIQTIRSKFNKSLKDNQEDPWFYMCTMNKLVKLYNKHKEQVNYNIKRKITVLNDEMEELDQRFCKIFENYCKIEENYHERIYELYKDCKRCRCERDGENEISSIEGLNHIHTSSSKFDRISDLYDPYDIIGLDGFSNTKSAEIYGSQVEFLKTMDVGMSLIENTLPEISIVDIGSDENNLRPIKYGVYKFKSSRSSKWIHSFIVFTRSNFMHVFDLSEITKTESNLKVMYANIIARLQQKEKRVGFFNKLRIEGLNLSEENELNNFSDDIMSNFQNIDSIIYSTQIDKEIPRLDKDNFEIHIKFDSINSFKDLFVTKTVKIKAFLLKDLYELHFAISHKKSHDDVPSAECVKEHQNVVVEEVMEDKRMQHNDDDSWSKLEDTNPWTEQ